MVPLQMLALVGILYVGFKKFKETRKVKNSLLSNTQHQTPIQNKIRQVVEETSGNKDAHSFEKNVKREIGFGLAAMGLSTLGFFYSLPILTVASVPLIIFASLDFFKETYLQLKQGKSNVSTIMSITVIGCLVLGYNFIAAFNIVIIKSAVWLTAQLTKNSKQKLLGVFAKQPSFVYILADGDVEIQIPFNELQINDIVIVQAGDMIPADGTVIEGMATVDQHILTGEAMPVEKEFGDDAFAATLVLSGKIYIKVEKAGNDSTVAKITRILNGSIDFTSSTQLRASSFSEHLVAPALMSGGIVFPILGFNSAVAIVNSHPKNKILLTAPIAILNYFNLASKQGILIKDGRSLELLYQVDTIIFDKTGTLTEEQPHVGNIYCCASYTQNDILSYAATAESKQTHPLAKAILKEAKKRRVDTFTIAENEYKLGYGLTVKIADKMIYVGSERFMETLAITIPASLKQQQKWCHEEGYSLVIVAIDKQVIGAIELLPTIRPEAKAVIRQLQKHPQIKSMYIISGDHENPTKKLAQELGIENYFAETLPENKATIIEQLQQQGHFVCYIGDGINDAIALKRSPVSISLRGASSIATDTAQIILMDQGLNHLDFLFRLANDFNHNTNTTFAIASSIAAFNVIGVFLLGFTIAHTVFLNSAGLVITVINATMPLIKHSSNQKRLDNQ